MKICNISGKKFTIAVLIKLREFQENTGEFSNIKRTIHKQNGKFQRQKSLKKSNKKYAVEGNMSEVKMQKKKKIINRTDQVKRKICETEESPLELFNQRRIKKNFLKN